MLTVEGFLGRDIEARAASGAANLPRILSSAEEWLLWRQCAAEATRDWDLVNRSSLAEALRRASALAHDNCIDVHRLQAAPGTEPALLREVQSAVEARCRTLAAATLASIAGDLPSDLGRALFKGFVRIPPRLAAIGAQASDTPDDAGLVRPSVVIAPDDLTELELIACWCKTQIGRRPDARLLVVHSGSPGSRARLATLIHQTLDAGGWLGFGRTSFNGLVSIEGGSPLARHPAIAHALSTLKWLSGEGGDFATVSEWLRSPYWNAPEAPVRARADVWLRERARMQFDLAALVTELQAAPASIGTQIIAQIASASAAMGQGAASPRDWSLRFRAALTDFGWPGARARSSDDQQTLARFHELLDEFGQLAGAATSIPRDTAAQWLAELAARTPFRPADDDPVVTITPMLVHPVVHYDAIWVAGLHSEVLPQPVQPDPFLPLAAQLEARIPAASAAGRLQEARSLLGAWRASTQELVLSAPARSEDLELLPSPLLTPWLTQPGRASARKAKGAALQAGRPKSAPPLASVPVTAPPEEPLWLPLRLRRTGLLEAVDDRAGLAWDTVRPLPSGTRSLELQNTCPFRAYAELRLGTGELGAPEPGVDPRERGDLLHVALQRFWARVVDSQGLGALGDSLGELIERCVDEAADSIWGAQHSRALLRERRRALRLINALCELERQRAPFRVTDTELEAALQLAGAAQVNLRIDRIDRLDSGGRAILDYKSGQRPTADWYGDRPSHPQLLAYMAALGEDVVAMATVNVTAREVRFDGIASSPQLLPKVKGVMAPDGAAGNAADAWRLRQGEWRERVEQLAAGFVAGHAAVDPKQGACDYCHAKSVCRIAERAMDEPEADPGDVEGFDG